MQQEAKDSAAAPTAGLSANGMSYHREEYSGDEVPSATSSPPPSVAASQADNQAASDVRGIAARGPTAAAAAAAAEMSEGLLVGNIWPPPGAAEPASAVPSAFSSSVPPGVQHLFGNGLYPYGTNGALTGLERGFASVVSPPGQLAAFAHASGGGGGQAGLGPALLPPPPVASGRSNQMMGQKKRAITAQYNVQSYQKHAGPGKQSWGTSGGGGGGGGSGVWSNVVPQAASMSPWHVALQQQHQQQHHQQQQRGRLPPSHSPGMMPLSRMPPPPPKGGAYMAYGHHAPPPAMHFMQQPPPPPQAAQRFQAAAAAAGNRHYGSQGAFFGLMQDDGRSGSGLPGSPDFGHGLMTQDLCQNGLEIPPFDVLQNRVLDMPPPGQPDYRLDSLPKGGYLHPEQDPQRLLNEGLAMLEHGVANLDLTFGGPSFALGQFERPEHYSRKVFVGGLPPDIDEEEITSAFRRFGPLIVDWPHKAESKSYFPPKGYCFLLFHEEPSVQALIDACHREGDKIYWCVTSPSMKDKPVQIRPWNLSDSDYVMDGSHSLDPRKTIFVGGVPRPLRAVELALIMDRLYGCVCYAGIDIDPELKYPKGAGRVAFSSQQSYIAAISARFVQLQMGDIDKRVEVKPYVLDDQVCDECQGTRCGAKFAPYFCANITCLQYYCDTCWGLIHSRPGREYHKPLMKEGTERPRTAAFRWN